MILADKIIDLRKKAGWSQDELASKLNVMRQSVSKWEGAQSIPDMERIVRMSRLFGVTTDYLLKDELETEEFSSADADTGTSLRRVSMEQASNYLALRKAAAPRIALATLLCIVSPIVLIVLACACESSYFGISEDAAALCSASLPPQWSSSSAPATHRPSLNFSKKKSLRPNTALQAW